MERPSVSHPPEVLWSEFQDLETMPNAGGIRRAVQQAVNTVWDRLPDPVREIIALDQRAVELYYEGGDDYINADSEETRIMLTVSSDEFSPQWERRVMWHLADAFTYAFMRAVATRMARGDTGRDPLPETWWDSPVAAWAHSFENAGVAFGPYQGMTEDMVAALVEAWGFGEEPAAVMKNGESPDGDMGDEEPLLPAPGNILYLSREPPLRHQSHDEQGA